MWDNFLYANPVAPAVVGLCVSVVLGAYWLSRGEVTRGERQEGPAAGHPLALLVQGALALAADKRLLIFLLAWRAVQSTMDWAFGRMWRLQHAVDGLGQGAIPDVDGMMRYLTQGGSAVRALEQAAPGAQHVVPSGVLIAVIGLVTSWLLLRHVYMDRPAWMQGRMRDRSLGVGIVVLALCAVAVPYGFAQTREFISSTAPAREWSHVAVTAAFLPIAAFVGLCPLAAIYELASGRRWSASSVGRHVVQTYWVWLGWSFLAGLPALVRMSLHLGEEAWIVGLPDTMASALHFWLPVVLFPLPWLLLEQGRSLGATLAAGVELLLRAPGAVMVFVTRFASLVAPVYFLLGALEKLLGRGPIADVGFGMIRTALAAVCIFAVCRGTLSIAGWAPPREGQGPAGAE